MHTVAIACNWAPHNLREVAQAIYDYIDGKTPTLPGPDFPTGGVVINKKDIPDIMRTGKGGVKIRGRYKIENNAIVFTEIPYGVETEALMAQIGSVCESDDISEVKDIRNESNKKGFRLVIECEKSANLDEVLKRLFARTNLQTSFAYNQVALVNKTPTELNLEQCIENYVNFNCECINKECDYDINKSKERLHIIEGLLKALDIIDDIIAEIKGSQSSAQAKISLMNKWNFTDAQAQAILDMKLSKLAKLEKVDLNSEKSDLNNLINQLNNIKSNPSDELKIRLKTLVDKYGDDRKTELTDLEEEEKTQTEEKKEEPKEVEPEKCVVIMTEAGNIKRIPAKSFKPQKKGSKGVKSNDEITTAIIRTNTVDNLMIFTDKGMMYRLLVNDIPEGTNNNSGTSVKNLVQMDPNENAQVIYSIYKDTDAEFVLFTTKQGLVKKTSLKEYENTKKKAGIGAIALKDNDELASVCLVKDEPIILITKLGMMIKFDSTEIHPTSRMTAGVKGITLRNGDEVIATLPVHDPKDYIAVFCTSGIGKKLDPSVLTQ